MMEKRHSMMPKQQHAFMAPTIASSRMSVGAPRRSLAGATALAAAARGGAGSGVGGPDDEEDEVGESVSGARRTSTVSAARRSSIGAASAAAAAMGGGAPGALATRHIKNDPRSIRSKKFSNQEIHLLITYLSQHSYDALVSPQILSQPSMRDFTHLFCFLYHGFDPYYPFGKKFDAEVSELFRDIGYPFTINKSALASVGSSHTWPTLLAALAWMVRLLTFEEELTLMLADEVELDSGDKMFFAYICKCYNAFLTGVDNFGDLEEELASNFEEKNANIQAEYTRRSIDLADGKKKLERLRSETSPLAAEAAKRNDFLSDVDKFSQLIGKLEAHRGVILSKLAETRAEEKEKQAMLASLSAERAAVQQVISSQSIHPEDVERMQREKAKLQSEAETLREAREAADNEVWEKEVAISRRLEALEGLVRTFNGRAKLLCEDSEHANGLSLEISLLPHEMRAERMTSVPLGTIEAGLATLRASFGGKIHHLQDATLAAAAAADRGEEQVAEQREVVDGLGAKIKKLELQAGLERDAASAHIAQLVQETEAIEAATYRLKAAGSEGLLESERTLEALRAESVDVQQRCQDEKEAMQHCLISMLDTLAGHKELVSETLAGVQGAWEDVLRGLISAE